MKYLLLILVLMGCCPAHIVQAPPDGKHIPVTVECSEAKYCSELLEQICHSDHYRLLYVKVNDENKYPIKVKVQCNP